METIPQKRTRGEWSVTHGHARGGKSTSEYNIWLQMRGRCGNPRNRRYADYGGRGVRICERWESFEAFLADMGPRPSPKHTLDRKNNDGDYEPGNCRWATSEEQNNNSRRNRSLTYDGRTMNLSQWARERGICPKLVGLRLKRGWTVGQALGLDPRKGAGRV